MSLLAAHGAIMAAAGSPPVAQTVLSATYKASDIILTGGDRIAASNSTAGGGMVLSVSGKNEGDYYYECIRQGQYAPDETAVTGLHRGTSALGTWLGADGDGWGVASAQSGFGSRTYAGGGEANVNTSAGVSQIGQRYRVAVRLTLTTYAVWLALSNRNSGVWIGGGDPVAGTLPTYSGGHGGDTFYIALNPRRGHATIDSNRNKLELALPANWAFSPPSGFGVWE